MRTERLLVQLAIRIHIKQSREKRMARGRTIGRLDFVEDLHFDFDFPGEGPPKINSKIYFQLPSSREVDLPKK